MVLKTEFGLILIELNRTRSILYKDRVITCTKEHAPIESELVRNCLKEGFNYYIAINFAKGSKLSQYTRLLEYFIAIGMGSAWVNYIKERVGFYNSNYNTSRSLGELIAYLYISQYDNDSISTTGLASMYVKSNMSMCSNMVLSQSIAAMEEIIRRNFIDYDNYIEKCKNTRSMIRQVIVDDFWIDVISIIIDAVHIEFNKKNDAIDVYHDVQKKMINDDTYFLIEWIKKMKKGNK